MIAGWPARSSALKSKAEPFAGPSLGNTAALAMDARELVGTAAPRTIEVNGVEVRTRVLDAVTRRGTVWATVRLEDPTQCRWVEVAVPVAGSIEPEGGALHLVRAGDSRRLRAGGARWKDPGLDAAADEGAEAILDGLRTVRLAGPRGAPTRAILARSGGGAFVAEINVGGLGSGSLVPMESPSPRARPTDR